MSIIRYEMKKGTDTIVVEIMPDGLIKTMTDKVSAPEHINAEALMRDINKLSGSKSVPKRRTPTAVATQQQQQKG